MAPKKKTKPKSRKKPIRRVAATRKLLKQTGATRQKKHEPWKVPAWKKTATSPGQLSIPGLPPEKPREYSAEELQRTTVQTLRPGVLRAKRWQAAAALDGRAWAQWACRKLDDAADAAGVAPLPQGAR